MGTSIAGPRRKTKEEIAVDGIVRLALEELPAKRAEIFMTLLHSKLPSDQGAVREVLNGVHKLLHEYAEGIENYLGQTD
mgnify:CR=1 FL=1